MHSSASASDYARKRNCISQTEKCCLWGHALKRSPWINRKSWVSYPGPGFLSSATWPLLSKKHYNGLINQPTSSCYRHYKRNRTKFNKQRPIMLTLWWKIEILYFKILLTTRSYDPTL